MKAARTTIKDIEIRVAIVEQGFVDIRRRLDHIEVTTARLSAAVERGIGAWKGLFALISIAGVAISLVK